MEITFGIKNCGNETLGFTRQVVCNKKEKTKRKKNRDGASTVPVSLSNVGINFSVS